MLRARKASREMDVRCIVKRIHSKRAGRGVPARKNEPHHRCEDKLAYEAVTGRAPKQALPYSGCFPNCFSYVASENTFLKKEKPIVILCLW